jgi:hypothetical protein
MTRRKRTHGGRTDGARTSPVGTPFPVDVSTDREARVTWIGFLAGPVIWFAHFMFVYLVAEAGCTGGGPGLRLLDPPVAPMLTLVATAFAALACLWFGYVDLRRSRAHRNASLADAAADDLGRRPLAFVGALLAMLSSLTVLAVGLPAAYFTAC